MIKPNWKKSKEISSERERRNGKKAKKLNMSIDHTVECKINRNTFPSDAVFKYRDEVIGQDIVFERKNTRYFQLNDNFFAENKSSK